MKPDIHPDYHPVVFVDGEHEVVTKSTLTSKQTRSIDGVDHYVINVDISAFSHPFFTGKQKLVDTEGRVDRFNKRYAKANAAKAKDADEKSADESDESAAQEKAEGQAPEAKSEEKQTEEK